MRQGDWATKSDGTGLLALALYPCVDDVLGRIGMRIAVRIVPGADVLRLVVIEGGLEIGV